MNDDINYIPSDTPDFQTELAEKLAELAPEAIADGKIDVEKLKELLNGDADESNERFGLFWPGKKRALRAAQQPTTATLKPDLENSKDWDTTKNVFIEGDNLEVLKVLQKHYHGKIKMIYIDPPYNTGKDFVYPDNFKEGLDTYLEWTKQVNDEGKKLSTNSESEGRYHSNWLNMMYPRLKLARNLLTNDGVIFVSIDDNEFHNLFQIMLQVFGEQNYLNTFTWVNNLKGRQITGAGAAGTKETVIAFARNAHFTSEFKIPVEKARALMPQVYKGFDYEIHEDEHGPYVVKNELYNTNSAFNEKTRPNLVFDIYYNPSTREVKTADVSNGHVFDGFVKIPPKVNNNGVHKYHAFRWSRGKVESEQHNLLFKKTGQVYRVYTKVRDVTFTSMKDLILGISTTAGSKAVQDLGMRSSLFDYPKPPQLIEILASALTDDQDIVVDFFSGSGSTAHAVMQLNAEDGGNRRHIQIQLPEPTPEDSEARKAGFSTISKLSRERIHRAGEKIRHDFSEQLSQRDTPLDVGFRAYKLSDTNFSKWQVSSDTPANELEQQLLELRESANDNATPADLFVELLLKHGYSLTESIGDVSIAGLDLKTVLDADGDVAVLAYLDEHTKPTLDQLREIADSKPVRFVILEDCFQGDDELKTNLVQICKTNGIELWTA